MGEVSVERFSSWLGTVEVRWSAGGVQAVDLIDDSSTASPTSAVAVSIAACIDDPSREFEVELAPQGTEFQLQVWAALRELASGETVTYAELAERLGLPATASRAVGTACGRNPIAVLVPCHRVVRADGDLAGYRWGLDRKRALLEREGAVRQRSLL